MNCPKCGSPNIKVEFLETGKKTKNKGVGMGGHLNNAAHAGTAICTLGISNLFWKKSKGTEKTTNQNVKIGLCQDCGYDWKI